MASCAAMIPGRLFAVRAMQAYSSLRSFSIDANRLPQLSSGVSSKCETRALSSIVPQRTRTKWPILRSGMMHSLSDTPRRCLGLASKTEPTIDDFKSMPRTYAQMSNDVLIILSAHGDHDAARGRLTREIMLVDNLSWRRSQEKLEELEKANKEYMTIGTAPYKIGLATSLVAGLATFPLCFDVNTAKWFNEKYVTTDVADDKDLETFLEVGSWSWGWMEPPLGQLSFFLLCLAFARNQLLNLGWKPYTHWLLDYRAQRLQQKYPQYNATILRKFSETDTWL